MIIETSGQDRWIKTAEKYLPGLPNPTALLHVIRLGLG